MHVNFCLIICLNGTYSRLKFHFAWCDQGSVLGELDVNIQCCLITVPNLYNLLAETYISPMELPSESIGKIIKIGMICCMNKS